MDDKQSLSRNEGKPSLSKNKLNKEFILLIIKNFNYIDGIIDNLELFYDYIIKLKLTEREEKGEVITNIKLLIELFDKIEEYVPDIYKNNYKWFDSSAGIGIFFIVLYKKLIKYHTKEEILNNMLYFSEINKDNIDYINCIFNNDNKYKLNIYYGDTLTLNIKDYFNIDKFDIITHNPPYNSGCIQSPNKKREKREKKYKSLWQEFINYSFNNLKQNGYMLSINPNTFYRKDRELHKEILENEIYFIYNYDNDKSKEIFDASIPISIYFLKYNSNNINKITNFYNYNNGHLNTDNIMIDYNKSLSTIYQNIFYKLYDYVNNNKLNIEYNIKNAIIINDKPIILKNTNLDKDKYYSVYTYTIKDGIILRECKEHIDQNKKKIILKNQRCLIGSYITDQFGICGRRGFYILKDKNEDLLLLQSYFNNYKLPLFVSLLLKYSQSFIDNDIFYYIPDITKIKVKNENELLKLIGLTKEERNIILNFKNK